MRVVLDTNILISCCWTPGGNEWRVVELVRTGQLCVCLSPALLTEYEDVAGRKKFAEQRAAMEEVIGLLRQRGNVVTPDSTCNACSDLDDNRLMECALAGGAAYVVTGNLRHFPPFWESIAVVNARRLLELLENHAPALTRL